MKNNNSGFTLVELLAVITILGILATITVPIVINVFNSASESAFEDDAMTLSKAADNYYTSLTLESDTNDLEDSINKYSEAMKLVKECDEQLKNIEESVNKIVSENGELEDLNIEE